MTKKQYYQICDQMKNYTEKINDIRDTILKHAAVKCIYLFGSYAYGEPNEDSDIDVYVITQDKITNYMELYTKIIGDLGHKKIFFIDLILSSNDDFNDRKSRYILERIVCDKGILLYGHI